MSALKKITLLVNDGIRASLIMGLGDVIAQTYVDRKQFVDLDWKRTVKFAGIGLLYVGPSLHTWYGFLNRTIAIKQPVLQRSLKKMAIDQLVFAPIFTLSMLAVFGVVNGEKQEKIEQRVKNDYIDIMKLNYMLWPAAQIINFGLVPLKYQVTFAQIVAVIWNTYMSAMLNTENKEQSIEKKRA